MRTLQVFNERADHAGGTAGTHESVANSLPPCIAASLSRRTFLGASSAVLISSLIACGGEDSPTAPLSTAPPGSVTLAGRVLTIRLAQIPALTAANGNLLVGLTDANSRADVMVINVGGTYRAFSSICTHEGCTVSGYRNRRLVCPCHGSEFDERGQVVAGPAPRALPEYPVQADQAAGTLTVTLT